MTYQRPAYEQVSIEHDGHVVVLRPSLRAATILEARYGFPALFRALNELNLTIIADTILTASSPQDGAAFLRSEAAGRPLSSFFLAVRRPLGELVSMFVPTPVQPLDTTPQPLGETKIDMCKVYRGLYRVATGVLGWTPEAAWNATPTEINEAFMGKLGIAEKQADPEQAERNVAEGLDPEFDRAGLRALKAKIAGGTA